MSSLKALENNVKDNVKDNSDIIISAKFSGKGSDFQAHAKKVSTVGEAYEFIGSCISSNRGNDIQHYYSSYRMQGSAVDIDEGKGSQQIKYLLNKFEVENTVVVVTRKYGGIHIGNERWTLTDKATRDALNKLKSRDQMLTQQTQQQSTQQSGHQFAQQPAQQSAQQPAQQSAQQPAQQSAQQPAQQSAQQRDQPNAGDPHIPTDLLRGMGFKNTN